MVVEFNLCLCCVIFFKSKKMQKAQRLAHELAKIRKVPPKGISFSQRDDKLEVLDAVILGPEDSPYEHGVYQLEIKIPQNYPISPPSIKFITKVYHPNIDDNGRICLDLFKMPPKGTWRPTISLEGLLIAIRMLLQNPNPDDPLMAEIAEEYRNNRTEFEKKARNFTIKYANGKQ